MGTVVLAAILSAVVSLVSVFVGYQLSKKGQREQWLRDMKKQTFYPTACPIFVSTEAHLLRALSQVRATCAVRYHSK